TLTMVVSSTSMKVGTITAAAISHGLTPIRDSLAAISENPLFHPRARFDGHAGAERQLGVWDGVEENLHRDALHHFNEIAGRIFRREDSETGASGGLKAVDVAVEVAAGISVQ